MTAPETSRTPDSLAVYVHWPFCRSKCPYCDFNSHVSASIDHARWRAALLREIDHYADRTPGRTVSSIFFGGGTPSLMEPATAAAVIEHIGQRWRLDAGVEITLEANPTSVEAALLAGFRSAGVNRVSLGVQALNDADLKFLGREHSAREALEAVDIAARLFDRFSFDLIYARPGQTVEAWEAELRQALSHAVGHISAYQLTIEEGTPFHLRHARGEFKIPDEDTGAALYEATQAVLEQAGLPAYEISNHARPGEESRHNLAYWRYADYAGIGPGAHGRLTLAQGKIATRQHRAPQIWLERVERDGHATQAELPVLPEERLTEMLMMGLRTVEGVPADRFLRETGQEMRGALDPVRLERLVTGGFLIADEAGLRATAEGRQRLNALLPALLG
ncbi:MAG: radical SAM family heme chaperone HemW [Oceanibaculum nanhaiense]|uniref:radical SAM family heme chaperone HemW n=1 Tax=Oceanibaculum nanhaiense TaxID=1909734 RepID=UPI0025A43DE6|nr:radical SAM family heme chaperone HemW [Oceanibaculum nanhaiense]MDM7945757.1 radical SAM family heme chaperone HemW [Oceanibaculum nanhaiense]